MQLLHFFKKVNKPCPDLEFVEWLTLKLDRIERRQDLIMAGMTELQAAIDAAPQAITDAVVDAVKPLILSAAPDTQPAIDKINALPSEVASAVSAALTSTPANG